MMDIIAKYKFSVFFSKEEQEFIGICSEFPSLSGFGRTSLKAIQEIQAVVKDAVEILEEIGKKIPEPFQEREYKGKILLRIDPETHRQIAEDATERQRSINQHLTSLIDTNLYRESIVEIVSGLSKQIMHLEEEIHAMRNLNKYEIIANDNLPGILNKPTPSFLINKQPLALDWEHVEDKYFVEA